MDQRTKNIQILTQWGKLFRKLDTVILSKVSIENFIFKSVLELELELEIGLRLLSIMLNGHPKSF